MEYKRELNRLVRLAFAVLLIVVQLMIIISCADIAEPEDNESETPNWELVWSDEFDVDTIDLTKWGYDIGTGIAIFNCPPILSQAATPSKPSLSLVKTPVPTKYSIRVPIANLLTILEFTDSQARSSFPRPTRGTG